MAINVSALNSTLQTKIDALDAATDTKEVLLLSKALDAAAGSTSVSDVLGEGVVQVNNVNSEGSAQVANVQNEGATQRTSVAGVLGNYTPTAGLHNVATSGDYNDLVNKFNPNTLHSVAQSGNFNDLSNKPGPAGLLNTYAVSYNGHQYWGDTSWNATGLYTVNIPVVGGASSKFIVTAHIEHEGNHEHAWRVYRSVNGGGWTDCAWGEGSGNPNYAKGHFMFTHDADSNSTIDQSTGQYIDSPNASSTIAYRIYIRRTGDHFRD